MPRMRIALFGAIAIVLTLGILSAPESPLTHARYDTLPVEKRDDYWASRIRAVDGGAAYREFVAMVAPYPTPLRHMNAHFFGVALYDTLGPSGITVCDGRFVYGCFHAFAIRAVELGGLEEARAIYARCSDVLGKTAEQCEHGVGHGILGTIGYGPQDLDEALYLCDALGQDPAKVEGCPGGVFMEYGIRGMQGLGTDVVRPFEDAGKLEPCMSLTDRKYLGTCAYWQTMWWTEVVPQRYDPSLLAPLMGEWCEVIAAHDRRVLENCIAGIGNRMQLLTGEDPSKTARICALVTQDPLLAFICHRTSAARFTTYYPLEFSLTACDGLPAGDADHCRQRASAASAARLSDRPE